MYGYVYKTTNKLNGKIYIGKKKSTKMCHEYFGSGIGIQAAINKYGKENFSVEMLQCADSLVELNNLEKYWIEKLNSRNSKIGYNIAPGGDGGVVWGDPKNHPSLGKHGLAGERNPFYGRHHTPETRAKISQHLKEHPQISNIKGKHRVHKDGVCKYVTDTEIQAYVDAGWTSFYLEELERAAQPKIRKPSYGMLGKKQSDSFKQRISELHKGKKLSESTKQKIKQTLANRSDEAKKLHSEHCRIAQKQKCWVHNDNEFKRISLSDLESYLNRGYRRGRKYDKEKD